MKKIHFKIMLVCMGVLINHANAASLFNSIGPDDITISPRPQVYSYHRC